MKSFLLYIFKILLIFIISVYVLDFFYTYVYENYTPRTKFQNIRALKGKSIDYVFLGSSRVENGVLPDIIEKKTGKKSINLGFQASKLADIYFILQLLDEYNVKYKKALIQIDYIYNIQDGYSNVLGYQILPFINENELISNYCLFSNKENFYKNKYIPFFRYIITSEKLGAREIFANIVKNESSEFKDKGYISLEGTISKIDYSFPKTIKSNNKFYDSIINYTKKNKKEVVFFTAPFKVVKNDFGYMNKLKCKITNLNDFSNKLQNNNNFINCNHLNDFGARNFTNFLIKELDL